MFFNGTRGNLFTLFPLIPSSLFTVGATWLLWSLELAELVLEARQGKRHTVPDGIDKSFISFDGE